MKKTAVLTALTGLALLASANCATIYMISSTNPTATIGDTGIGSPVFVAANSGESICVEDLSPSEIGAGGTTVNLTAIAAYGTYSLEYRFITGPTAQNNYNTVIAQAGSVVGTVNFNPTTGAGTMTIPAGFSGVMFSTPPGVPVGTFVAVSSVEAAAAVPEPACAGLGALGLFRLLRRRRATA